MNKISFIIEFDEVSKTQEEQLTEFIEKTGIKFHVLENDNDLKKYEKYKEVIDETIKYIKNASYFDGSGMCANDLLAILEDKDMLGLKEENQELKQKYLNAVSDYETTMFEKEQLNSLVNSCQEEIRQLKKQLEDANEQISYLRRSIERKEERIIDLQYERIPYTNEYVDKLLNQQKEFISYLENEINICDGFLDTVKSCLRNTPYRVMSSKKTYITNRIKENEIAQKVYKEILQKYKSIIGVLDEKSNNISS